MPGRSLWRPWDKAVGDSWKAGTSLFPYRPKTCPLPPAMNDDKVHYTTEERELLAELYREDILREKREKALQRDVRIYDAARRRVARKLVANAESSKSEDQTNE